MQDNPEVGLWWPQQTNYDSVDFFIQPNELAQCTINRDHKPLSYPVILSRFEVHPLMSDVKHSNLLNRFFSGQTLFWPVQF